MSDLKIYPKLLIIGLLLLLIVPIVYSSENNGVLISATPPLLHFGKIQLKITYQWNAVLDGPSEVDQGSRPQYFALVKNGTLLVEVLIGEKTTLHTLEIPIGSTGRFQLPLEKQQDILLMEYKISVSAFPRVKGDGFAASGKIDWNEEGSRSFEVRIEEDAQGTIQVELQFLLNMAVGFRSEIDGEVRSQPLIEIRSVEALETATISTKVADMNQNISIVVAAVVLMSAILLIRILLKRKVHRVKHSREQTSILNLELATKTVQIRHGRSTCY